LSRKKIFSFFLFPSFPVFVEMHLPNSMEFNSDGLVRVIRILILVFFKTTLVDKIGLYVDSYKGHLAWIQNLLNRREYSKCPTKKELPSDKKIISL